MLLIFLYHRVGFGPYSSSPSLIEEHLKWLSSQYSFVLPGGPLQKKLQICLTFDDATFDFYYRVFPLLQRYQIPVLLAVPVQWISETCSLDPLLRLAPLSSDRTLFPSSSYCSWEELREMKRSGLIRFASHSFSHVPLIAKELSWKKEIVQSKQILEQQLGDSIDTFVYPFGKFHPQLHQYVRSHYRYAMRIGSAMNFSWRDLLYRIPCDGLTSPNDPCKALRFFSYALCYVKNRLRHR